MITCDNFLLCLCYYTMKLLKKMDNWTIIESMLAGGVPGQKRVVEHRLNEGWQGAERPSSAGRLRSSQEASLAAFIPWNRMFSRWPDLSDATVLRLGLLHLLRRRILNRWRQICRVSSIFGWKPSLLYLGILIECHYKLRFRILAAEDRQILFLALIIGRSI